MIFLHDKILIPALNQLTNKDLKFLEIINDKKYRVADTGLSYRKINYLYDVDIFDDSRDDTKEWRKFSLKELIFLRVIGELRGYGLQKKHIESVKKSFFNEKYGIADFYIADLAILTVLAKERIILAINNNFTAYYVDNIHYKAMFAKETSHICINLNELIGELLKKKMDYKTFLFNISDKEHQLMDIIQNEDYDKIEIKTSKGEIKTIKAEGKKNFNIKELGELLEKNQFCDISVQKRNGNITNFKFGKNFKLD